MPVKKHFLRVVTQVQYRPEKRRGVTKIGVALLAALTLGLAGAGVSAAQAVEPQFGTGSDAGGEIIILTLSDPAPDDDFLDPFVQVSAGVSHTLGLSKRGDVWGWGDNDYGQVGTYGTVDVTGGPKRIDEAADGTALPKFTKVEAGQNTSFAIDDTGNIWAWGINVFGKLGVNGTTNVTTGPMKLTTGSGGVPLPVFTDISSHFQHTLAVDASGGLWVWGNNTYGALGVNGTTDITDGPAQVTTDSEGETLPAFVSVAAGGRYSHALDEDGNLWGWGYGGNGQLGLGYVTVNDGPQKLVQDGSSASLPSFTQLATGANYSLALDDSGNVWSWGERGGGRLGIEPYATSGTGWPVKLVTASDGTVNLPKFASVWTGDTHGFATDKSGNTWGWGWNDFGQAGTMFGTAEIKDGPHMLTQASGGGTLPLFKQITGGSRYSVGLDSNGFVWSWGNNNAGIGIAGTTKVMDGPLRLNGYFIPDVAVQEVLFGGEPGEVLNSVPDLEGKVQVRTPAHEAGLVNVIVRVTHAGTPQPFLVYKQAFEYRGTFSATPRPGVVGTVQVGKKLTVDPGTWSPNPTFKYQWLSNGSSIRGATKTSYTVTAEEVGKKISVAVTGSRTSYDPVTVTSIAKTVSPGELSQGTPTIKGTPQVGKKLTAAAGTWPAGTTLTYQWLRNGKAISGSVAKKSSYTLEKADRGKKIAVKVTGTKPGFVMASASSAATAKVAAAKLKTAKPSITGKKVVGKKLKVKPGAWTKGTTFTYQWLRNGKAISGSKAKKSSYTLEKADRGKKIAVKVTGKKPGYATKSKVSAKTAKIR